MDLDRYIAYGLKNSTARHRPPPSGRERLLRAARQQQAELSLQEAQNPAGPAPTCYSEDRYGQVNFFSTLLEFFRGLSPTEDLSPALDTSRLWSYHVAVESIRVLV